MIKVLILTADAGFGHRSAAIAVESALRDQYADQCQVSVYNPLDDKRTPFFIRDSQADYDLIIKHAPELFKLGYDISDATVTSALVDRALTLLLYELMQNAIKTFQPDVVLTTYPLYQAPFLSVCTVRGYNIPLVTAITDLVTIHRSWFNNRVDALLVPTEEGLRLAEQYNIPSGRVHLTGIPVHPDIARERRDKHTLRKLLDWETDLPTFLAVGSKRVEHLLDTLKVFNHFGAPMQLAVIAGKNQKLYQGLQQIEWQVPVRLYNYVENMPTLLRAADAVICKAGGLMVTESLAAGKPLMIVDVLPGQEVGNAEFVIEHGAGDVVTGPHEVYEVLAGWMRSEGKLLTERSFQAQSLGKPYAAYDAARIVMEVAESGSVRKVREEDSYRMRLVELLENNKIRWQTSLVRIGKNDRD